MFRYFKSNNDRACTATDYAFTIGGENTRDSNGNSIWWLRTTGLVNDHVACSVSAEGSVYDYRKLDSLLIPPYNVSAERFGVRPAIWVDIES